jgi:type VI secretion system protein VasG
VKLSHRYIPARQLPDKAVALLDTACARVAVSQSAPPAQLEDCLRHLRDVEIEIAEREARVGRRRRARNGVTSQNVMRMKQT